MPNPTVDDNAENSGLETTPELARVSDEDEDLELTDVGLTEVAGGNPPLPPKPPGGG